MFLSVSLLGMENGGGNQVKQWEGDSYGEPEEDS